MTHSHRPHRRGFTLLEVMVALAILALAMVVMVDAQMTAVMMTTEAQKMLTANMLAQEKMNEVILCVESVGFQESDIDREGDFSKGLYSEYEAGGLDGTFGDFNADTFEGYNWAFTIRKVELDLSGDITSMMGGLAGSGALGGESEQSEALQSNLDDQSADLGDVGVTGDMISEQLAPFIREVRVVVWWGDVDPAELADDEESLDQIELVTHLINPNGDVVTGSQNNPGAGSGGCF